MSVRRLEHRAVWAASLRWEAPLRTLMHHGARCLAERGWRCAYLSYPISPFHLTTRGESRREFVARRAVWREGGRRHLDDRVWEYVPWTWLPPAPAPILSSPWVLDRWHRFTMPDLRRRLAAAGYDNPPLLALESLAYGFCLDALRPGRSAMFVTDYTPGFRWATPAMLARERELMGRVDHVFYTAHTLLPHVESGRPRAATYLPNAAEVRHFLEGSAAPPEHLDAIPAPRAIYVGALYEWFDTDLLAEVARRAPGVSFVIIGSIDTDVTPLRALSNVHLLGRRPYASLPAYLKNASVGLIPFRVNDLIRRVNPVKLYEYLACGLPVVSARWDELEMMRSPAVLCDSAGEFADAVLAAVNGPVDRESLRAYARQNDWSMRFERMLEALGLTSPR